VSRSQAAVLCCAVAACGRGAPPPPAATVTITIDRAASAVGNEAELLVPVEEAVAQLPRIGHLHGIARDGAATLVVELEPATDPLAAAGAIRDALSAVARLLPADAEAPVISVQDGLSKRVVAWTTNDAAAVRRLEGVAGVREVTPCGIGERLVRVRVDPSRLAAFGIDLARLVEALRTARVDAPEAALDLSLHEGVRLGDVAAIERGERRRCTAVTTEPRATAVVELAVAPGAELAAIQTALGDGAIVAGDVLHGSIGFSAGSSEERARIASELRDRARAVPGIRWLGIALDDDDPTGATVTVGLATGASAPAIAVALDQAAVARPGLGPLVLDGPGLVTSDVVLRGDDLDRLVAEARGAAATLRARAGIAAVACDPGDATPRVEIAIDRDRAAELGVAPAAIAEALQSLTPGGLRVPRATGAAGTGVVVEVDVDAAGGSIPRAVAVTGRDGPVRLDQLVTATTTTAPREIRREDRRRAVVLHVRAAPAITSDQLRAWIRDSVPSVAP